MKIAFDAQPLTDDQKTGVGFCEAEIVKNIMSKFSSHQYFLPFFCFGKRTRAYQLLSPFEKLGGELKGCRYLPASLCKTFWAFVSIPYWIFFGKEAEVTHFFNFYLPPGVHGKSVLTVHDMAFRTYPETVRFRTKAMLRLTLEKSCRRADKIITVSLFTKQELMRFLQIPENKIEVVRLGVDTVKFNPYIPEGMIRDIRRKYGIPQNYLLYLGTLEPRKNLVRVVEAYSLVKKKLRDAPPLVLAGRKGWFYRAIFDRISALGLQDSVLLPGYVKDEEVPALLGGAVAFLFPSIYEGFGLPPLEAMACGTPVLTSNTSSLPEVAGDDAVLVNPASVEEIAVGMERLLTDEKLRKELSRKGRERAEQFSWERASDELMKVYISLTRQEAS